MHDQPTWRIWPLLWLLLVLQTTYGARLVPFGVHIDFVLLAVVSVALLLGMETGAIFGLVAGIFTGYCAGVSLGSFAFSRLLIGAGFGFFDKRFSRDNPFAPPICAGAATLVANAVFGVLSPGEFTFAWWLHHTFIATIAHAILIWPVYSLFARLIPPPRAFT